MPDLMPVLISLLTIVLVAVLLGFAVGTHRNVRRGNDLLRWLQGGLPLIGKTTTLKWLGSSAVQLDITDPKTPFSQAQVVVVLEPRDVGWLWAWARSRGRRDFVILRGRLERSPRFEMEAGDRRGWTGRDRLDNLDPDAWSQINWGYDAVEVAHGPDADPEAVRSIWDELASATGGVWRLSVRRDAPHIEVHVMPPGADAPADPVFRAFTKLARTVVSRA
jgi:hypothetical protein